MNPRVLWWAAGVIIFLIIVLVSLIFVPLWLYPPLTEAELRGVATAETRIQLQQAQSQLQNSTRTTLLQAIAGLLVVAGAIATWRQVQVNREGQITERFTRAVDHLGNDNVDVRLGGIYALQRVAKNSHPDRPQVQYVLAAFVRGHAPWPGGTTDEPGRPVHEVDLTLPWLYVRAPDVQAAMNVLGRRLPARDVLRLYLSRVDLRSVNLDGAELPDTAIRHANLARAWLVDTRLDRADLYRTDLRQAKAVRTSFVDASLRGAYLAGADLSGADLRRADLRGADMRAVHLDEANLTGALANETTIWPEGFDQTLRQRGLIISSDDLSLDQGSSVSIYLDRHGSPYDPAGSRRKRLVDRRSRHLP